MIKPHASDWEYIRTDLQYSKEKDLYWYNDKLFDKRSAFHNGIIGIGYSLKEKIKETNNGSQNKTEDKSS